MRFMTVYKPGRETTAPPSQREMADMGQFIEELTRTGVLLATGGLQPSSKGARVRLEDRKFTVIDGPFAETKELIGGYAIIEVKSKSEAIEVTRRFLEVVGRGECEVRLMDDETAVCSEAQQEATG